MCYQVEKREGRRDNGNSQGIVRNVGERLYVVGTVHRRLESKARAWPKRLFPLCWPLTSSIKMNRTQPNLRSHMEVVVVVKHGLRNLPFLLAVIDSLLACSLC